MLDTIAKPRGGVGIDTPIAVQVYLATIDGADKSSPVVLRFRVDETSADVARLVPAVAVGFTHCFADLCHFNLASRHLREQTHFPLRSFPYGADVR